MRCMQKLIHALRLLCCALWQIGSQRPQAGISCMWCQKGTPFTVCLYTCVSVSASVCACVCVPEN